MPAPDDCWICERRIEGNLAAIARNGDTLFYQPFIEDLRTSAYVLAHPACFANEHGLNALIAIIHERDFQERARDFARFETRLKRKNERE